LQAPDPDDLQLVALARTDTPAAALAFTELVRRHRPWLVRHLTRLLRNEGDAQDLAQEAFARAHAAIRRRPPDRSFSAWLRVLSTRIAHNHRRDEQTRSRYHARLPGRELDGRDSEHAEQFVRRLLETLRFEERQVLVLRYLEDWSIEEIGAHLGIGSSAAKMRLLRARRALSLRHLQLEGEPAHPHCGAASAQGQMPCVS
jgi:RNA polymerase sigma-70 factor (ECF subfamily)